MSPTNFIIFDFDGTLFDTHNSISHCITLTFDKLLAKSDLAPSQADVYRLISIGAGLQDTFKALHPDVGTMDEESWTTTYRSLYSEYGQPLISPFDGASELLVSLQKHGIPTAIVSNKGVAAVLTALKNNNLDNSGILEDMIVGDKTSGATRKPDLGSYINVLIPALKARGYDFEQVDPSSVLVVGDTEADIRFATNIGATSVWCRYGYGNKVECEKLKPSFTVDSLLEIETIIGSSYEL